MTAVQLIADTNVLSYLFHESLLGVQYEELIGSQSVGVTGHSIAELRAGAVMAQWGERRLMEQWRFLDQFTHVADTKEMAEVCGALRGVRSRIGQPIDWPDAWAAACALWLNVPLVTHDRDLEGIPGLRVLTVHKGWRVREAALGAVEGGALWLGERPIEQDVEEAWLREIECRTSELEGVVAEMIRLRAVRARLRTSH
jgi:predicted nucleic acid-binding protein